MKLFERGELRLLWPFYLEGFITLVLFFAPVFYVIYFKQIGLSLFQAGLVWAMAPLFSLLTDIPTGAIADLYGRKFSVLVGNLLQAICLLLVYFTTDFYALLVIFALLGVASTFVSGAYEAWTTELVRKHDKKLLHPFFTKKMSIDSAGLLLGGLVGATVVKVLGIRVIWLVAAAAFFAGFVILLFAKEQFTPKRAHVGEAVRQFHTQMHRSLSFSFRHHVIV
ncbi:MAG: MFS transporter, partial [Nanoarchaeota archaeon]